MHFDYLVTFSRVFSSVQHDCQCVQQGAAAVTEIKVKPNMAIETAMQLLSSLCYKKYVRHPSLSR